MRRLDFVSVLCSCRRELLRGCAGVAMMLAKEHNGFCKEQAQALQGFWRTPQEFFVRMRRSYKEVGVEHKEFLHRMGVDIAEILFNTAGNSCDSTTKLQRSWHKITRDFEQDAQRFYRDFNCTAGRSCDSTGKLQRSQLENTMEFHRECERVLL